MTLEELKHYKESIKHRLKEIEYHSSKTNENALLAICKSVELILEIDSRIYDAEKPMERIKLGPGKPG